MDRARRGKMSWWGIDGVNVLHQTLILEIGPGDTRIRLSLSDAQPIFEGWLWVRS